eukprot:gene15753-19248_t
MRSRGMSKAQAEEVAMKYLTRVRIPEQAHKHPSQLSGGQQQRVAICRALMQQPRLILADEPIASLDPRNARTVMDALAQVNSRDGITVLVNLHHLDTAREYCNRVIAMQNGRVVFDGAPSQLDAARITQIYGITEAEFEAEAAAAVNANPAFAGAPQAALA